MKLTRVQIGDRKIIWEAMAIFLVKSGEVYVGAWEWWGILGEEESGEMVRCWLTRGMPESHSFTDWLWGNLLTRHKPHLSVVWWSPISWLISWLSFAVSSVRLSFWLNFGPTPLPGWLYSHCNPCCRRQRACTNPRTKLPLPNVARVKCPRMSLTNISESLLGIKGRKGLSPKSQDSWWGQNHEENPVLYA